MRVLLVSFSNNPDMQCYLHNLGNALRDRGLRCFALGSSRRAADVAMVPETMTLPVPAPSLELKTVSLLPGLLEGVRWASSLAPDIVHFVSSHLWNIPFAVLMRRRCACMVVHTIHDPVPHTLQRGQVFLRAYNAAIARLADAVILHNNHQLEEFKRTHIVRGQVSVATLGHFTPLEFEEIHEADSRSILSFGRLSCYKGLDKLLLLADELSCRGECKVTLAGRPMPDLDRELLQSLRDSTAIRLIERFVTEEEKMGLFRKHSLVVLTNTSMTQSGVILDAFRHGRAVVCFDIPGVREQVSHGRDGFIVPAYNVARMADTIAELTQDTGLLNRIGREAWESGRSRFSVGAMAAQVSGVYERVRGLRP